MSMITLSSVPGDGSADLLPFISIPRKCGSFIILGRNSNTISSAIDPEIVHNNMQYLSRGHLKLEIIGEDLELHATALSETCPVSINNLDNLLSVSSEAPYNLQDGDVISLIGKYGFYNYKVSYDDHVVTSSHTEILPSTFSLATYDVATQSLTGGSSPALRTSPKQVECMENFSM